MDNQDSGISLDNLATPLPQVTPQELLAHAQEWMKSAIPKSECIVKVKANHKTIESMGEIVNGLIRNELNRIEIEFSSYMPDGYCAMEMADGSVVFSSDKGSFRLPPAKFDLFDIPKV